jgi:hypothetical protein
MSGIPRPAQRVAQFGSLFAPMKIWQIIDGARRVHQSDHIWADVESCIAVMMELVPTITPREFRDELPETIGSMGAQAAALSTWRIGQGIYRFDDDLRRELLTTPITGELPGRLFTRLPQWCVYVETPGYISDGVQLAGFFAFLTLIGGRESLQIVSDCVGYEDKMFMPYCSIGIDGNGNIADRLEQKLNRSKAMCSFLEARDKRAAGYLPSSESSSSQIAAEIAPLLSLLLFLTTDEADIDRSYLSTSIERVQSGKPPFVSAKPTVWDVGVRIGAALRKARSEQTDAVVYEGESGRKQRPHLRSGHFHTYRYGPRSAEQERRLRWLHPILINDPDPESSPVVVHPVEKPRA